MNQNVHSQAGAGRVVATEKESSKAARARSNWDECGKVVLDFIDLREGDLLETLKSDVPEVDMLLLDSEISFAPNNQHQMLEASSQLANTDTC